MQAGNGGNLVNAEQDCAVLVIGGGGREHALAWKLAQSPKVQQVYVAPGNGGTARDKNLVNVPISDVAELRAWAQREQIALTFGKRGDWVRCEGDVLRCHWRLIEQPLAASDRDGVSWLASQRLGVPMFADESVSTIDDIRSIATDVDGVVVKVRKFGGVAASLEAITLARSLGLRVMIGCMIESSVATTAAAHLGGCCDLVDLDAPLLIANDPYEGVRYEGSTLYLPDRPGIGILPRVEIR